MAKKGITLPITFVERDGKLFPRKAHNAGNTHLNAINECMKRQLSGQHYGSRAAQVQAFRAARASCR